MSSPNQISRARGAVLGLLLSLVVSFSARAELTPYSPGQWSALLASRQGQPMLVHFWGFSCPPCVEELPAWADFARERPSLRMVFVEVDPMPEGAVRDALTEARLIDADNRANDTYFDEYFRHEIDPQWFGELPVTLMIDSRGRIRKMRGTADFAAIGQWADREAR